MHWPQGLSGWTVALGIAGFFYLILQKLVVNFLSSKIENWWAERSVQATLTRITKLEEHLKEIEVFPTLTLFEDRMVRAGEALLLISGMGIVFLGFALMALGTLPSLDKVGRFLTDFGAILSMILGLVVSQTDIAGLKRYRLEFSLLERDKLQSDIDKLKERLPQV